MQYLRRINQVISLQIVLYAVALAAVLYAISTPLLSDPIINLLFGGIIPGTNIVLAPMTMMQIAIGSALLAIIIPIAVAVLRSVSVKRDIKKLADHDAHVGDVVPEPATTQSNPRHTIEAVSDVQQFAHGADILTDGSVLKLSEAKNQRQILNTGNVSAIKTPKKQLPFITASLKKMWAGSITSLRRTAAVVRAIIILRIQELSATLPKIFIRIRYVLAITSHIAADTGRVVFALAVWFVFFVAMIAILFAGACKDAWLAMYAWSKPYMRRFDGWLELRYRGLERGMLRRLKRSEVFQVVSVGLRDSVGSVRRLLRSISGE